MKDHRLRYYYLVKSNSYLIYEGFILHDEAWSLLDKINSKNISLTNTNKTNSKTSQNFSEFKKSINQNCKICNKTLGTKDPFSTDYGGDCVECMAKIAEDPDAISVLSKVQSI